MTSNEAYRRFNLLINKEVNGYFNPTEFEEFINMAQDSRFNELIGFPEKYQPGRAIPPGAYDGTERVKTSLLPFMTEAEIELTDGVGLYNAAEDFAYFDANSVRYYVNPEDCGGKSSDKPGVRKEVPISERGKQEWAHAMSSEIDIPTHRFPIFRFLNSRYIEVSPFTIEKIRFDYLRKPARIYWGRRVVNGLFEHDPNDPLNVDPEWADLDMGHILLQAAKYTGLPLDDQSLFTMATQTKSQGG